MFRKQLMSVVLLSLGTQAYAALPHSYEKRTIATEDSITSLTQRIDEISQENIKGKQQGKIANASVDSGPFFNLDFLYLQAREDGLEYAQKETYKSRGNPFVFNSKFEDLDFEWNPGFKVGVGYICPTDNWDMSASWTYLHSNAHDSSSTNDPTLQAEALRPNWFPIILGSIADKASAHWRLNYNIVDLEMGRNFFLGKRLSVRPHAGVKGIWIDQKYHVNYHGGFQYVDGTGFHTQFKDTSLKAKNDFKAVGMTLGADSEWSLSRQWSLLANISGTLAYGRFAIREHFDGGFLVDAGGGAGIIINDNELTNKESLWRLRPSCETELGIRWHVFFNDQKYRVALEATYNFIYWPNQNELMNTAVARDSLPLGVGEYNLNSNTIALHQQGDLQLQGLKVELRFDF